MILLQTSTSDKDKTQSSVSSAWLGLSLLPLVSLGHSDYYCAVLIKGLFLLTFASSPSHPTPLAGVTSTHTLAFHKVLTLLQLHLSCKRPFLAELRVFDDLSFCASSRNSQLPQSLSQFAFCCYTKNTDQTNLGEETVCYAFTFHGTAHLEGNQGRYSRMNLDAGTEADTMEGHCLLLCSHACSALFLIKSTITWPRLRCQQWT